MFPCPKCKNMAPANKRRFIKHTQGFQRTYFCCGTFYTEELLAKKRKIGRPKKAPSP